MDIVLLLINLVALIVVAHRVGELRPAKPVRAIEPARAHRLVRTWVDPDPGDGGWPGWRFMCSCGTQGMATNISDKLLGSEQNAVKQFSSHAALFAGVNEDGWKHKHDTLKARFDWYVSKCYCRHTNDELIEWRNQ